MSDGIRPSKSLLYVALLSIAANVFMCGFLAARLPMVGAAHDFGPGDGRWPSPHFNGPGGPDMPPPPFIGGALFTPQEMDADRSFMDENFNKIHALRKAFAAELTDKDLTVDKIREHFVQMDKVRDELQEHLRQKIIDKISSMTPQQRKALADRLRQEE